MKNFVLTVLLFCGSKVSAADLSGHWKGDMVIHGAAYSTHLEIAENEDPIAGFTYLLTRFTFPRNDFIQDNTYFASSPTMQFYFYSVKDAGTGATRSSGVVTGYWLQGKFDFVAGTFFGTVQEIISQPGGVMLMDSTAVGDFELRKGPSIAASARGMFESPDIVDPSKSKLQKCLTVTFADGKLEIVVLMGPAGSSYPSRMSATVENDQVSFAGYFFDQDASGTFVSSYRFFEGKMTGLQLEGNVYTGDFDPSTGTIVKNPAALGKFSFR